MFNQIFDQLPKETHFFQCIKAFFQWLIIKKKNDFALQ